MMGDCAASSVFQSSSHHDGAASPCHGRSARRDDAAFRGTDSDPMALSERYLSGSQRHKEPPSPETSCGSTMAASALECPYRLDTSHSESPDLPMTRQDVDAKYRREDTEDNSDGPCRTVPRRSGLPHPHTVPFFLLGLLNNASYCLMLACAKSIVEGGTALVFLATVIPSMLTKASAPYWFHSVSYALRMRVAAFIMGISFLMVGVSHAWGNVHGELFGVAVMAVQGGLGEASLLALAGKLDPRPRKRDPSEDHQPREDRVTAPSIRSEERPVSAGYLTSFSSGTGLSGVFAFFWKVMLTEWFGWSLETTLFSGLSFAWAYHWVFCHYMGESDRFRERCDTDEDWDGEILEEQTPLTTDPGSNPVPGDNEVAPLALDRIESNTSPQDLQPLELSSPQHWTLRQRFHQVCALWPYTVPLFTVYAAEYACMAGAWTAIGFPVNDVLARNRFYTTSNWLYQVGVFVSRSSGTLFTLSMPMLWLLPLLQCLNLVLFVVSAATYASTVLVTSQDHGDPLVTPTFWLYSPLLFYGVCLYTGLLGGAVYVHGYKRIVMDKPAHETEFALAASSVAESIGILVADVVGLFMQSCLYKANGLTGAVVSCPL